MSESPTSFAVSSSDITSDQEPNPSTTPSITQDCVPIPCKDPLTLLTEAITATGDRVFSPENTRSNFNQFEELDKLDKQIHVLPTVIDKHVETPVQQTPERKRLFFNTSDMTKKRQKRKMMGNLCWNLVRKLPYQAGYAAFLRRTY